MPTQEERLAELERKVAAIELRRLYDERKAAEVTPAAQVRDYSEINQNLAMLLGIASGQEGAIGQMQGDMAVVKGWVEEHGQDIGVIQNDVEVIKRDLGAAKERVTSLEGKVEQGFASLGGKVERVDRRMDGVDQRLAGIEQSLQQLTAFITKPEQGV